MGEILEIWIEERGNCIVRGRIGGAGFCSPKGCLSDKPRYEQLPKGWSWTRLDNITNIVMGQSPVGDSVTDNAEGVEFHQGKIFFTDRLLAQSGQYTSEGNKIADKNSVLLCVRAPVGIVNITNRKIAIGRGLCALSPLCDMSVEFLFHLLTAFQDSFIEQATGTTFIAITTDVVRQQLVPLPPLAEQRHIVSAIESAFAFIDEIEQNKNDLQSAIAVAKQKILSLAIRGKLVPQDPNDEPASVLLERIRAEREKLISEGKIKRGKGDSAIIRSGDNPYYEKLPDGWVITTVDNLFFVVGGGTPSTNKVEYWGNGIPWFSSADINENGVITPRRCVTQLGLDNSTTNVVPKGSVVVVTRVGLGKVAITDDDMCFSQDNQALIPQYSKVIDSWYLFHFMFHEMQTLKLSGRGTTISGITKKQLSDIYLWIPPFAEQHRIVVAVETAFEQLDNIAAALM